MKKCKIKGCHAKRFRRGYKTCHEHWQLGATSKYVPKPEPKFSEPLPIPEKKPAPKPEPEPKPRPKPKLDKRRALSDEQLMCIRNEYKGLYGQQVSLAKKYGVHVSTITNIVRGKTNKHLF